MKILGSDLDGTLSHGGVGEAKCAAVHAWRAAGHKFGIISGRGGDYIQEIRSIYPALELDFFAACNGGYITDCDGRVLHEVRCTEVSVPRLVADLAAWGCGHVNICCTQTWSLKLPAAEDRVSDIPGIPGIPNVEYFNQISTAIEPIDVTRQVVERIRETYGEWLNPLQNGCCIDIVPRDVNKAKGMYFVMELFGGSYEDVLVVGDNVNDADMIREFRSYAMSNGVESIKKMADAIVDDVTDLLEMEL